MIRHTREEKPNTFSFVTCEETRQIPAGKARDARGDYFLNFSSLTGIPVRHGSSSRDSRHTARKRRADFFRGLVSARILLRGVTARWAVALNARLRNNLYGQCACTHTSRDKETERERERERERNSS